MAASIFPSSSGHGPAYRGRFAPSPTGPLHLGSLIAAVGSYLQAHSVNGAWLVRIEDLDPPREVEGAADDILRTLERFGLEWDGPVTYQSRRLPVYGEAIERLEHEGLIYPCGCSRKEIAENAQGDGLVYPGTCRNGLPSGRRARALRVRTPAVVVRVEDLLQGPIVQHLARDVGDFVVKRADGMYAYQLAVVVDDADQGITEVVRGSDLLPSTPRQVYLQDCLGLPHPDYLHLPVAVNRQGEKLSKQTGARALNTDRPLAELLTAMRLLGQQPPAELADASLDEFWRWARDNWQPQRIPPTLALPEDFG